jgi:3-oxoacyl-[acyl-carrier protein] reductase
LTASTTDRPDVLGLRGRTALVTGGSRGLGLAVVTAFAHAGMNVVTCCRGADTATVLRATLATLPGEHRAVAADVTTRAGVDEVVAACRDHLGSLDVVVNNVGANSTDDVATLPLQRWREMIDANLTAAFLVTQATLAMVRDSGSIITIGSALSTRGLPGRAHYTAAKAGLTGLTRSLCKELGPRGIRVNLVAPGILDSDAQRRQPEDVQRHFRGLIPLGRLGPPDEVAGAVVFLASRLGSYVNGTAITVDGGI